MGRKSVIRMGATGASVLGAIILIFFAGSAFAQGPNWAGATLVVLSNSGSGGYSSAYSGTPNVNGDWGVSANASAFGGSIIQSLEAVFTVTLPNVQTDTYGGSPSSQGSGWEAVSVNCPYGEGSGSVTISYAGTYNYWVQGTTYAGSHWAFGTPQTLTKIPLTVSAPSCGSHTSQGTTPWMWGGDSAPWGLARINPPTYCFGTSTANCSLDLYLEATITATATAGGTASGCYWFVTSGGQSCQVPTGSTQTFNFYSVTWS